MAGGLTSVIAYVCKTRAIAGQKDVGKTRGGRQKFGEFEEGLLRLADDRLLDRSDPRLLCSQLLIDFGDGSGLDRRIVETLVGQKFDQREMVWLGNLSHRTVCQYDF